MEIRVGQGQWCNWGKWQAGKRKLTKSVCSAGAWDIDTFFKVILVMAICPTNSFPLYLVVVMMIVVVLDSVDSVEPT